MPLSQIDTVSAPVVIDMQKGIMGLQTIHPAAEIAGRIAALAKAHAIKKTFPRIGETTVTDELLALLGA